MDLIGAVAAVLLSFVVLAAIIAPTLYIFLVEVSKHRRKDDD